MHRDLRGDTFLMGACCPISDLTQFRRCHLSQAPENPWDSYMHLTLEKGGGTFPPHTVRALTRCRSRCVALNPPWRIENNDNAIDYLDEH
jgi:hypothetical protein